MTPSPVSGPREGDVFAGKYRVDRILGQGGMGMVVAATHLVLGHQVALKFLLASTTVDDETTARVLREAQVTARLKSVHVAKTLDVGQLDDGRPFLVMELLDGTDIDAAIAARGPIPITDVVDWILQACEGLAEAHANGIVHRDLKPSNLFLARDPSGSEIVKVLDFGISKLATEGSVGLTTSSAAFGSPQYMSPEQLRSSKGTDARSDVWSLGVILYEVLCGRAPFRGETVFALAHAVAVDPPEPPAAHRPDIPPALASTILACLEKQPSARPQSVAALAERLAPFAGAAGQERAERVLAALAPGAATPRVVVSIPAPRREETWDSASTKLVATRPARRPWVMAGVAMLVVGGGVGLVASLLAGDARSDKSKPPQPSGLTATADPMVTSASSSAGANGAAVTNSPTNSATPSPLTTVDPTGATSAPNAASTATAPTSKASPGASHAAGASHGAGGTSPPHHAVPSKSVRRPEGPPPAPETSGSTPSGPFIDQRTN